MTRNGFCGLDFGTSNSTVSIYHADKRQLVPLEEDKTTLPSVIFFNQEEHITSVGRKALESYLAGIDGRLMRSLKSVLGTSLMQETTKIGRQNIAFQDILGYFIRYLKQRAESHSGTTIDSVVLGRPVQFVDDDEVADKKAQDTLEAIARAQGFKQIAFQYEPIAAALDYEQEITREEIALTVDIGGGTSDFCILRLSPEGRARADRNNDILANKGVHIGGTDFDYNLSVVGVMPHLGYQSPLKHKNLIVPNVYYHDLATWHKINFLYTYQILSIFKSLEKDAVYPELLARFVKVLEERLGHRIAMQVEQAKIALTDMPDTMIDMDFLEENLSVSISRSRMDEAIIHNVNNIVKTLRACVEEAQLGTQDIDTIFLTGGSTAVPSLYAAVIALFPQAKIVSGDRFGSVGMGLAVDARRKFA